MSTLGSGTMDSPMESSGVRHQVHPIIRKVTSQDLSWAIAEGWRDFREKRGDLIFVGLIYPLIGLLTAMIFLDDQMVPLFFPIVAGLSILGPAVASGFYELAKRREQGEAAGWSHFLDPIKGRNRDQIAILTLGLGALFVLWLACAWAIYGATLGQLHPVGASAFLHDLFTTREGVLMIVLGNAAGALFAIATLVLSVVSFPMMVDRPVAAGTAIMTSIRAVRANPAALAQWGLRIVLLLALGTVPAFIGLAVVLPVLGYATWHLYTKLVER